MKPLEHIDGLGERGVVAKLLKELAAPTTKPARLRAIGVELGEERLVHQGEWAPVAPFAVPPLLACLEDAAFADHPSVLLCVAHVAAGEPTSHWMGSVAGAPSLAMLTQQHPASLAVQEGRAAIEALLDAPKPLTRALAAFVLALLPLGPHASQRGFSSRKTRSLASRSMSAQPLGRARSMHPQRCPRPSRKTRSRGLARPSHSPRSVRLQAR